MYVDLDSRLIFDVLARVHCCECNCWFALIVNTDDWVGLFWREQIRHFPTKSLRKCWGVFGKWLQICQNKNQHFCFECSSNVPGAVAILATRFVCKKTSKTNKQLPKNKLSIVHIKSTVSPANNHGCIFWKKRYCSCRSGCGRQWFIFCVIMNKLRHDVRVWFGSRWYIQNNTRACSKQLNLVKSFFVFGRTFSEQVTIC